MREILSFTSLEDFKKNLLNLLLPGVVVMGMGMDVVVGIFVVIVGDAVVSSTVFPSDCLVKVVTNIGDCVVVHLCWPSSPLSAQLLG
jgi:hypothetical protein